VRIGVSAWPAAMTWAAARSYGVVSKLSRCSAERGARASRAASGKTATHRGSTSAASLGANFTATVGAFQTATGTRSGEQSGTRGAAEPGTARLLGGAFASGALLAGSTETNHQAPRRLEQDCHRTVTRELRRQRDPMHLSGQLTGVRVDLGRPLLRPPCDFATFPPGVEHQLLSPGQLVVSGAEPPLRGGPSSSRRHWSSPFRSGSGGMHDGTNVYLYIRVGDSGSHGCEFLVGRSV
jgi:hypothetical protein